jgi:hypothetical protein
MKSPGEIRTLRREVRRLKRKIAILSFLVLLGLMILVLAGAVTMIALLWLAWFCIKYCRGYGEIRPKPVRFCITPSTPGAAQIPLCTVIPERRSITPY